MLLLCDAIHTLLQVTRKKLYEMSSLLPLNYNEQIRNIFGDKQADIRYHAMGVNTGMERLVKMMKIGTLSRMLANQNP